MGACCYCTPTPNCTEMLAMVQPDLCTMHFTLYSSYDMLNIGIMQYYVIIQLTNFYKSWFQPNQLHQLTIWVRISAELATSPTQKIKPSPWKQTTPCTSRIRRRKPTTLLSTRNIPLALDWTALLGRFEAWVRMQLIESTGHWTIKLPLLTGMPMADNTLGFRCSLLHWASSMRSPQQNRTFLSSTGPQHRPVVQDWLSSKTTPILLKQ